ncbi:hypothetical protein [Asticcacaulis sp.]|uniref:hypothetical protein n=1 Tax=Asticcacaulis sp. TaxID=1872648 RepID=UPI002BEF9452|nr:hypothetical protein [Asticcacaulis sp.]HTM82410.1 hypothetical protein [Asticcacaulis sp.]
MALFRLMLVLIFAIASLSYSGGASGERLSGVRAMPAQNIDCPIPASQAKLQTQPGKKILETNKFPL